MMNITPIFAAVAIATVAFTTEVSAQPTFGNHTFAPMEINAVNAPSWMAGWAEYQADTFVYTPDPVVVAANKLGQLHYINEFVNTSFTYRSDMEVWGVMDRWVSPTNFYTYGGDCDDYAFAKMIFLARLGWSWDDMWITVGLVYGGTVSHAVLTVELNGAHYVLNQDETLGLNVVEDTAFVDFVPMYSINPSGMVVYDSASLFLTQ